MRRYTIGLLALLLLYTPANAEVADYPSRAIRILVGFPPGGGTDLVARLIAQNLSTRFGVPVIVDNKSGASGTVAAEILAKAAPDGYTISLGHVNSLVAAPFIYKDLSYSPERDFTPIVYVGYVPNILVVKPSLPAHSVQELVALAKSGKQRITFASAGYGSTQHIAGEMFRQAAGIEIFNVPYRGTAPAVTDLVAGTVSLDFETYPGVISFIKSGQLRALAVATSKRLPSLPDVPTMAELGYDVEVTNWYGMIGPANLPPAVVAILNKEINTIIKLPDVIEKVRLAGGEMSGGDPEEFKTFIRSETKKIESVVRRAQLVKE